MAEFRRRVTIDQPREEVWAFITDPANATRWVPNLKSFEVITEGEMGVGTRYRETRVCKGKDAVSEIEVTAWEPPVEYAAGMAFCGAYFEYRYQLCSPTERSTTVELIGSAKPKGILGKLSSIPMLKMMQKMDGDQLKRLKGAMEGEEETA